ncbi:MAG: LLM class flavin-dependent oxidoreductase [Desulfurellaceae bacterium]|nr:LLM class flavin-dependent oxidoreductase [Desulfurellaceae bacterium]
MRSTRTICAWPTRPRLWASNFTPYTMVPDVVQFLTYMAGRTTKIELGTMVIVLPWHDPVRAAEQIAMLDILSKGRIIVGFGRGAASVEYNGFRVPMEESRERFVETAEVVVKALSNERFSHEGKYFQIPETSIRPRPFSHPERRLYGAAVSPDTAERMAKLGLGVLVAIPLHGWDAVAKDVERHDRIIRAAGHEPVKPIVASFVKPARARLTTWAATGPRPTPTTTSPTGTSRTSRATSTTG